MNDKELIGKLYSELQAEKAFGDEAMRLLAGVTSGEVDRSRVLVNLSERSFQWTAPNMKPGLPPQVNGKPQCVVYSGPTDLEVRELQAKYDALVTINAELVKAKGESQATDPAKA